MNVPATRRVLILFVLLVTSFGMFACKEGGCGKSAEVPKTPAARVEQMTAHVPAKADTVAVISDLGQMRETVTLLKNRLPNTGVVESVQKQFQKQFGIDLLDAEKDEAEFTTAVFERPAEAAEWEEGGWRTSATVSFRLVSSCW